MADPAIQTFCCIRLNKKSSPAYHAMMEFSSTPYNTVCLVSSFVGILGAASQILSEHKYLNNRHRWVSLVCLRGSKIITWLAFADLFACIGVFLRSIVNLNGTLVSTMWDNDFTAIICTFFAAWIQYWYCATWMWTICYTVDIKLALLDKPSHSGFYHLFCWLVPAALNIINLLYLFYPDASCFQFDSKSDLFVQVLPNYLSTYLPMVIVMVLNPILYCDTGKHVRKMVYQGLAQCTNKEREIVDSTYIMFTLINIVFYACWLPNLVTTVLIWSKWQNLPITIVTVLWYTMAIMNPLQALLNCLVYGLLNKKMNAAWLPIQSVFSESTPLLSTNSQARVA